MRKKKLQTTARWSGLPAGLATRVGVSPMPQAGAQAAFRRNRKDRLGPGEP
jgi:hypothetical protein